MIELRWIVRRDRRELQYRQWKSIEVAAWAALDVEWTDWQNVEHFIEFDNDSAEDTLSPEQGRIESPA